METTVSPLISVMDPSSARYCASSPLGYISVRSTTPVRRPSCTKHWPLATEPFSVRVFLSLNPTIAYLPLTSSPERKS